VLTLYTTPVVYLYLSRVQSWLNRGKRAPAHEPDGEIEREPLVAAE
jgi:hypothetical protein